MKTSRGFTLIELLIVIAIIGILMALLFPAVGSAIDAARKAQAKNDVTQIATAIIAYETEYGHLPASSGVDVTLTAASNTIIGTLMGTRTNENSREIVFLEVNDVSDKKGKSGLKDGDFVDPWGNPYQITLDGDYDNSIEVKSGKLSGSGVDTVNLRKTVGVFNLSTSSDKKADQNYYRRSVRSWE